MSNEEISISTLPLKARDILSPEPVVVHSFPNGIGGYNEALDVVSDNAALHAACERGTRRS